MSTCCENGWQGFYDSWEWMRSKRFDHDYYGPVERGDVELVKCPVRDGYHLVPVDGGHWHTGYRVGKA